jgi:hypothetical protein
MTVKHKHIPLEDKRSTLSRDRSRGGPIANLTLSNPDFIPEFVPLTLSNPDFIPELCPLTLSNPDFIPEFITSQHSRTRTLTRSSDENADCCLPGPGHGRASISARKCA